jgi:hypothetical protein
VIVVLFVERRHTATQLQLQLQTTTTTESIINQYIKVTNEGIINQSIILFHFN